MTDPALTAFLNFLAQSTREGVEAYCEHHPAANIERAAFNDREAIAAVLTGYAPKRPPVNRRGQLVLKG